MGNMDSISKKNSQVGDHTFEKTRVLLMGSNTWVSVLPERMVALGVVIRVSI